MSGGNFARKLTIDRQGNLLAAKGPLHSDDDVIFKLYAYVYQTRDDGSGAAFTAELDEEGMKALPKVLQIANEDEDQWIVQRADPDATITGGADGEDKPEQEGVFHDGPATGVALTIARRPDKKTTVTWWTDTITLVRAGAADA